MSTTSLPSKSQQHDSRQERLEKYVQRYIADWPVHNVDPSHLSRADEEIVFLTGSTGTLGSQLLANLIIRSRVTRIYAFNRPHPKRSSRERHEATFIDKGNDLKLLGSPKIVFVEGDLSVAGFGIAKELFEEMRKTVKTIIHNGAYLHKKMSREGKVRFFLQAWPVKFTKPLVEFEANLRGVRNLIDFSLKSPYHQPPRLLFISSIGMVKSWADIPPVAEAPVTDVNVVGDSGYAESKWIAERILTIAGQETALKPLIIRVGQLTGGINGSWSATEWFPALVNVSRLIGCVPDGRGDWSVGFVPLYNGADAIVNLQNTPLDFAHLVHPRPISSIRLMGLLSESLHVKLVPVEEWLLKLRIWGKTKAAERHPAFKLIDLYHHFLSPNMRLTQKHQITGMAMFDLTKTSQSLGSNPERFPILDRPEIDRWIGYWKKHCWVENEARFRHNITISARL